MGRTQLVLGGVGAMMAGVVLSACTAFGAIGASPGATPAAGQRSGTAVSTAKAKTGPIALLATYSGAVLAGDTVSLAPKVSGRIMKLNVDAGSAVKAGDVIAELDRASLEAQVAQAQAGVDVAKVKLAQIQSGARSETIAVAQANADAAKAKLALVQSGARPETVATAKANLDAAKAKLALVQSGARPETVATAKANLDAAKARLAQLKDGATSDQVAAGQLVVEQAKNALFSAQTQRDGTCGNKHNPKYLCDADEARVDTAQTALDQSNQQLKILVSPPTKDAIDQAQAAVDAAQQQYDLAQKPYTAQDLAVAQAAVDAAGQQYELAQRPYTEQDIAQAQAAADAAAAQARLAAAPYTDLDVRTAQLAIQQAQAALDAANSQLAEATIVSPFDGITSAKLLSVGALASSSTPIVTLISTRSQVQFAVEEARRPDIKVGQAVQLSTSEFPDKVLAAKVANVFPSADPKTHTFTVTVEPQTGVGLQAGMSVELAVTLASKEQAVLVPRSAIVQQGGQQIAFVVAGDKAQLRQVEAGIENDADVEVVKGISAGEEVVTAGQASLADGAPVRVAGSAPSGTPQPGGTGAAGGTPGATSAKPGAGGAGRGAPAPGTPGARSEPSPTSAGQGR